MIEILRSEGSNLVRVLKFFTKIGSTNLIDRIAYASSTEELINILNEVLRNLESIRRSAQVLGERIVYAHRIREDEKGFYRAMGVEIEQREDGPYIVVDIPRDPSSEELAKVEQLSKECGARSVGTALALLARSR